VPLVFAYGSNLDDDQMRRRCPSSSPVGTASLPGYALAFGGHSNGWGGAVATLVRRRRAQTPGVVWWVADRDLDRLDGFEGVPRAYRKMTRKVWVERGQEMALLTCIVYTQGRDAALSLPPVGYLAVLWRGYTRWGFDHSNLRRAMERSAGVPLGATKGRLGWNF
jgi:gamma-glutamyl AIG2-like cyclotransferase